MVCGLRTASFQVETARRVVATIDNLMPFDGSLTSCIAWISKLCITIMNIFMQLEDIDCARSRFIPGWAFVGCPGSVDSAAVTSDSFQEHDYQNHQKIIQVAVGRQFCTPQSYSSNS